jgi:hypothetical protein
VSPKNCFEWSPVNQTSQYDVATKQAIPDATVSGPSWLGPGGYFDTFACAQSMQACTDSDGDGLCEFDTTPEGNPAPGTLDLWLVRQDVGSWQELGSTNLSGSITRDTRMISDGGPVCP